MFAIRKLVQGGFLLQFRCRRGGPCGHQENQGPVCGLSAFWTRQMHCSKASNILCTVTQLRRAGVPDIPAEKQRHQTNKKPDRDIMVTGRAHGPITGDLGAPLLPCFG